MLRGIEKAIQTSDLAVNPQNDGKVIRLVASRPSTKSAAETFPRRSPSWARRLKWPSVPFAGTPLKS